MARKRAPGGGRKPRGEGAAVHFNTRIAPEIRRRLERDAKRNKRSLSHEIEERLKDSIGIGKPDEQIRALCYLIGRLADLLACMERGTALHAIATQNAGFDWRSNRADFEAFKSAIVRLLDYLAPSGEPAIGYKMPGNYEPDAGYETPDAAGKEAARLVFALLTMDKEKSYARAEQRGAHSDNAFYAFPQAAKALNFHSNESKGGKS
jgi:hypothetical protein